MGSVQSDEWTTADYGPLPLARTAHLVATVRHGLRPCRGRMIVAMFGRRRTQPTTTTTTYGDAWRRAILAELRSTRDDRYAFELMARLADHDNAARADVDVFNV